MIVQVAVTVSSRFISSSPKAKGRIWGRTFVIKKNERDLETNCKIPNNLRE